MPARNLCASQDQGSGKSAAELDENAPDAFKFNISHHGDWVVLASASRLSIGCDVMSIEIPGRDKDQGRFFAVRKQRLSVLEPDLCAGHGVLLHAVRMGIDSLAQV